MQHFPIEYFYIFSWKAFVCGHMGHFVYILQLPCLNTVPVNSWQEGQKMSSSGQGRARWKIGVTLYFVVVGVEMNGDKKKPQQLCIHFLTTNHAFSGRYDI